MDSSYIAAFGVAAFYLSIETFKYVRDSKKEPKIDNRTEVRALEMKLLEERHDATLRMLVGLERFLQNVHIDLGISRKQQQEAFEATKSGHQAILNELNSGFKGVEISIDRLSEKIG